MKRSQIKEANIIRTLIPKREKGVYSSHHYDFSHQSPLRHHHMPKNHTHSTEPKVDISSFYRNKNI